MVKKRTPFLYVPALVGEVRHPKIHDRHDSGKGPINLTQPSPRVMFACKQITEPPPKAVL